MPRSHPQGPMADSVPPHGSQAPVHCQPYPRLETMAPGRPSAPQPISPHPEPARSPLRPSHWDSPFDWSKMSSLLPSYPLRSPWGLGHSPHVSAVLCAPRSSQEDQFSPATGCEPVVHDLFPAGRGVVPRHLVTLPFTLAFRTPRNSSPFPPSLYTPWAHKLQD